MFKRIITLLHARNKEFIRDKAAFGWNIFFPLFIIVGFSLIFSSDNQTMYRVGVVTSANDTEARQIVDNYKQIKYTEFVEFESEEEATDKLLHHKLDLVVLPQSRSYIVSETAPKGYVAERLLHYSQLDGPSLRKALDKKIIDRKETPYVEWLFPGILAMNMMFAAFYGVGFVIVRYRKNGVLKRFSVTPIRPFEFLTAQLLSRLLIMMVTSSTLFIVIMLIYGFEFKGNPLDLIILAILGASALVSIGFVISSRSASEELTDGLLNIISWPMMFLSEVWFSLEGANEWVRAVSKFLPLTYLVDGARQIMNDGATLFDLRYYAFALLGITFVCLTVGSLLFKWHSR